MLIEFKTAWIYSIWKKNNNRQRSIQCAYYFLIRAGDDGRPNREYKHCVRAAICKLWLEYDDSRTGFGIIYSVSWYCNEFAFLGIHGWHLGTQESHSTVCYMRFNWCIFVSICIKCDDFDCSEVFCWNIVSTLSLVFPNQQKLIYASYVFWSFFNQYSSIQHFRAASKCIFLHQWISYHRNSAPGIFIRFNVHANDIHLLFNRWNDIYSDELELEFHLHQIHSVETVYHCYYIYQFREHNSISIFAGNSEVFARNERIQRSNRRFKDNVQNQHSKFKRCEQFLLIFYIIMQISIGIPFRSHTLFENWFSKAAAII